MYWRILQTICVLLLIALMEVLDYPSKSVFVDFTIRYLNFNSVSLLFVLKLSKPLESDILFVFVFKEFLLFNINQSLVNIYSRIGILKIYNFCHKNISSYITHKHTPSREDTRVSWHNNLLYTKLFSKNSSMHSTSTSKSNQ